LITANTGLYGDLIRETVDTFFKGKRDSKTDIVVVGRVGKRIFDDYYPEVSYKFFELSDSSTEDIRLKNLLTYALDYSNIVIYHGVFKSILTQNAKATHVTGELIKIEEAVSDSDIRFLFEPSIEDIAEYFEKQILSLLMEQTMIESYLSKYASRMVSLDKATESINNRVGNLSFAVKKAQHKSIDKEIRFNLIGALIEQ
jgi:F-type H+-transporting ATPase subunit gamma